MRYNLSDKISMYFEFLIDDYQVDDTGVKNALGTKIGYDHNLFLFNKEINFRLEKIFLVMKFIHILEYILIFSIMRDQ